MQSTLKRVSIYEVAIPDVIEDCKTGFLVTQKDSIALAEKLELLINDSVLRQKMGLAGREKYDKEFTLTTFESRLKGIFNSVLIKTVYS